MDNRASRPLSHTEAMCRPVSSWVGDYQRITAVDCFHLFAFPFPSVDNEIAIARHKDPYGGPRKVSIFYSGTPGGSNLYFSGKVQALIRSSQGRFLSTNIQHRSFRKSLLPGTAIKGSYKWCLLVPHHQEVLVACRVHSEARMKPAGCHSLCEIHNARSCSTTIISISGALEAFELLRLHYFYGMIWCLVV
jgi:hypothetical protein